MFYAVELTPDDNDTFLVTCPQLPEVTTFGETEEEALDMAHHAIEEAIAARLSRFEHIPEPQGGAPHLVPVSLQTELKVQLMWCLEAEGVSRAELARRLNWHRPQVDRLFDARHATRPDQYDAAFHALGYEPSVTVVRGRELAAA